MDGEQVTSVAAPGAKIATAWGGVALASLVDYMQIIASALAAIYTLILIGEWCYKKFWRKARTRSYDRP